MGRTDDPPSFCRQKGAAPFYQMCMSVSEFSSVIFFSMSDLSPFTSVTFGCGER